MASHDRRNSAEARNVTPEPDPTPETDTPQPASDTPPIVRFSVNLAADSADILRNTAGRRGITVTDVFRRAIAIMEAIDDELQRGSEIVAISPSGEKTRLVFL